MAWNEPNGNKDKDPWNKEGDQWGKDGDRQGPPDLDEVIRNLKAKLSGLFGGKGGGGPGGSRPTLGRGGSLLGLALLVLVLAVIWLLSGIYIVAPAERGVVLRFGEYVATTESGPHWHIPYPIEKVELVDVAQIRSYEIGYRSTGRGQAGSPVPTEALMLTQDENIVDVRIAVQYRVKDAANYLFNVRNADTNLRQVVESALREAVGKSKMDFVLTEGRSDIVLRTEELAQQVLDQYHAGLIITSVNMQDAQPPEQVQAAFADAIKAREDQQRLRNEAEAYANDIIPRARGAAFRKVQEAEAYKSKVIALAGGETARFAQVLKEYLDAPEITEKRLYLEAMETVMERSRKVLVDVPEGTNVFYLPLDRMVNEGNPKGQRLISLDRLSSFNSETSDSEEQRRRQNSNNDDSRSRRGR
ncbi:FtsH protease activity modulator HflK [Nitrosococcus watsonii]|uniref:Protein HflK n=1 Tax=Nitrosococcus watsoni (strain C-113) TaxID=105559 RepID=D8KAH9_NITWC|nr:FtsH protease activity modulator HflK [Nitrosococcus watsonii]ADJ27494.1 HflK protein [Nitrosococcus watsonii C-113]